MSMPSSTSRGSRAISVIAFLAALASWLGGLGVKPAGGTLLKLQPVGAPNREPHPTNVEFP
jgi:hypothetical protein